MKPGTTGLGSVNSSGLRFRGEEVQTRTCAWENWTSGDVHWLTWNISVCLSVCIYAACMHVRACVRTYVSYIYIYIYISLYNLYYILYYIYWSINSIQIYPCLSISRWIPIPIYVYVYIQYTVYMCVCVRVSGHLKMIILAVPAAHHGLPQVGPLDPSWENIQKKISKTYFGKSSWKSPWCTPSNPPSLPVCPGPTSAFCGEISRSGTSVDSGAAAAAFASSSAAASASSRASSTGSGGSPVVWARGDVMDPSRHHGIMVVSIASHGHPWRGWFGGTPVTSESSIFAQWTGYGLWVDLRPAI